MAITTQGHKKAAKGRYFKTYSVWRRKTDELVAACLPATDCARLMGISVDYFYEIIYFQKKGRSNKWVIQSEYEDSVDTNLL
jgi:hypothetical protein